MESKINNQVETTSTETIETGIAQSKSTMIFNEAFVSQEVRADRFTNEIRETFVFECFDTNERFKAKKQSMLEIAQGMQNKDSLNYLLQNGWKAGEKMTAGAGIAIKLDRKGDGYYCTFYLGALGEEFDTRKIERKVHFKFDLDKLTTVFNFVIDAHNVQLRKDERLKTKRNSLNLD